MTMTEAYNLLPGDAKWSCSFGNPGNGGFQEYYKDPRGQTWAISNGKWFEGDNWSCKLITEIDDGMGGTYRPGVILSV